MDHARHLTDSIGARLTGSPACAEANEWTRGALRGLGACASARLEPFEFGEGWSFTRAEARLIAPRVGRARRRCPRPGRRRPAGRVRGPALEVEIETLEDVEALAGKVAGRILVVSAPAERKDPEAPMFQPPRRRVARRARRVRHPGRQGPGGAAQEDARAAQGLARRQRAVRRRGRAGDHRGLLASRTARCASAGGGNLGVPGEPLGVPGMVMAVESFDRVLRLLRDGVPVELELDVEASFHRDSNLACQHARRPAGPRRAAARS